MLPIFIFCGNVVFRKKDYAKILLSLLFDFIARTGNLECCVQWCCSNSQAPLEYHPHPPQTHLWASCCLFIADISSSCKSKGTFTTAASCAKPRTPHCWQPTSFKVMEGNIWTCCLTNSALTWLESSAGWQMHACCRKRRDRPTENVQQRCVSLEACIFSKLKCPLLHCQKEGSIFVLRSTSCYVH